MSESWADPESLEGDELTRWYLRSPAEIEQERQAAADRRYRNFFYGAAGASPDPALASPPAATSGAAQLAAPQARLWRLADDRIARTPTTLLRTAPGRERQHAAMSAPRTDQTIAYGALRAPVPSDQELAELRRQQAALAGTTRKLDLQNSWLAAPVLAAPLAVMGLEGAAAWAARSALPEIEQAPLHFVDREAWQRGAQKAAQALSDAEKGALRSAARTKLARANGISAREMQAEVHHSDPLEWAHLKPNADPNRLANLWGLRKEAHAIATREWGAFARSLEGRLPSQAELMEAKLRIDRLVEPYIRRAGLPRSSKLPGKGGPL